MGGDSRFEVIGWDDRVGFYLNFERLLMAVPADAAWVALSDHDDAWYPTKLEQLVPRLDDVILVTGQARVTSHPSGRVLLESATSQGGTRRGISFSRPGLGSLGCLSA